MERKTKKQIYPLFLCGTSGVCTLKESPPIITLFMFYKTFLMTETINLVVLVSSSYALVY